jgi:hypothetical protein
MIAAGTCCPEAATEAHPESHPAFLAGEKIRCSDWQCGEGLAVRIQVIAQGWDVSSYK